MAQRIVSDQKVIAARMLQRTGVSLLLIVMLFLAGSLLVGFVQRAWQEHQLNRDIEQQRAQNEQQKALNAQLRGAADFAESDVAAEQIARERLGMARDGETVLLPTIVLPQAPAAVPESAGDVAMLAPKSVPAGEPSASNVARWMQALFPASDAP